MKIHNKPIEKCLTLLIKEVQTKTHRKTHRDVFLCFKMAMIKIFYCFELAPRKILPY